MQKEYYKQLTGAGFKVEKNSATTKLASSIVTRYQNLPSAYIKFLHSFKVITNVTDTSWFNLIQDFNTNSENEFKWNHFELLSLEWSKDDDEELKAIKNFWKQHIPIILSVKDGYQYFAICLNKNNYGEIVHGCEPLFEETTKISNNFTAFMELIEKGEISILK